MAQASFCPASQNRLAGNRTPTHRDHCLLFLVSFLALYFELVLIRYLSAEIRIFAYLMNLPLIASFAGLGLGMVWGSPPKRLIRVFPLIAAALILVIAFSGPLRLTHLPFPENDYLIFSSDHTRGVSPLLLVLQYCVATLSVLTLVVSFFTVLGGLVGEQLSLLPPLVGYGVNLAGSLTGIVVFTVVSFLGAPPAVWLLIGAVAAFPFYYRQAWVIVAFGAVLVAVILVPGTAIWSPYYRIDFRQLPSASEWSRPSAYVVSVNHDYHQKMVDLSDRFLAANPDAEPNRSARGTYELPYRLVRNPQNVLVVGSGTGNDVASALRHGATHIDAVEIDPVILKLGKTYHPEHPYSSDRVTVYLDDARAFFKTSNKKYDLVVFAYLDSHTMLTSFSSVRLDNYVYTLESFREARAHLGSGGTLVLAFASGRSFITDRLFAALGKAFGTSPRAYFTGYDGDGVVFVNGGARDVALSSEFPEITSQLLRSSPGMTIATDDWPFLYLKHRTIPLSMLLVLVPFVIGCTIVFDSACRLSRFGDKNHMNLFLLGAGFLLLETSAVTKLSLLFGSTWVVNALVISSFISMALLANIIVMCVRVSYWLAYGGLISLLLLNVVIPYGALDSLPPVMKFTCAAILVGLPVLLSGIVFSTSFRTVDRPSQALGMNFLGAVIGGVLENSVMVAGSRALGVFAIVVYGLSAVILWRSTTQQEHTGKVGARPTEA